LQYKVDHATYKRVTLRKGVAAETQQNPKERDRAGRNPPASWSSRAAANPSASHSPDGNTTKFASHPKNRAGKKYKRSSVILASGRDA
jgi:hypothetical protein